MKKEMNNKGFSLVELIIVIAIMAVLIGVLAPQYLKYVNNSKVSTDITNAESIATAINVAVADNDTGSLSIHSGTAFAGGATVYSDGTRTIIAPACKTTANGSWVVTFDTANGVTAITLNGVAIWPNASTYESTYKK